MEKFNIARHEIIVQLNKITYKGDLSDLGNEIGIVIAKYLTKKTGLMILFMV